MAVTRFRDLVPFLRAIVSQWLGKAGACSVLVWVCVVSRKASYVWFFGIVFLINWTMLFSCMLNTMTCSSPACSQKKKRTLNPIAVDIV
jgi:hypothetical protein